MAGVTFDGATRIFGRSGGRGKSGGVGKLGKTGAAGAGGVAGVAGAAATPGAGPKPAVDSLDLDIADGEFLVLVGPSGCGKSTSLRMLAGLEPVDRGTIHIGGFDATGVRPQDRDVAMVFQNYALYPNMTVAQNMGFALLNQKVPKAEVTARVAEAARILQLEPLLHRKPAALSGGQRQRVAMGRAIVREPAVFCMDEPLSNLDAKLRVDTRGEISALQRRLGTTTVYVTHDQVEAMTMGDRVAVLYDGLLQQVDTPSRLYDRPVNAFVAGFMGSPSMNLLPGVVRGGAVVLDGGAVVPLVRRGGGVDSGARAGAAPGGGGAGVNLEGRRVTLGIRPEDVAIDADAAHPAEHSIAVDVTQVEELGAESVIHGRGPGPGHAKVAIRRDRGHGITVGAGLRVVPDPDRVHLFDGETGERLGD